MYQGKGVDQIEDLHHTSFADHSVVTVICLETFEHISQPFKAAQEIHRILNEDGFCFISVPMRLGLHAHPSDYWRYITKGLEELFKDFQHVVVWYDGYITFPDQVFALAWKSAPPGQS